VSCYPNRTAKWKKFDLENPAPVVDDEDEETLAAIKEDEGMRDVEAGRTVPAEEVRRLLPELHAYQNALVRKGLEEMRRGVVVSHEEVARRLRPEAI
jgi:predicted transcriptional regulator